MPKWVDAGPLADDEPVGSWYEFAIGQDDAYNHGADDDHEYDIFYEYTSIVATGAGCGGQCGWLTIHEHNDTINGEIPTAFDTLNCQCVVTMQAVDIGNARTPRTLTISSHNNAPEGVDVVKCVYDGQSFSYDLNEGVTDKDGHDVEITVATNGVWVGLVYHGTTHEVYGTVDVPITGANDLVYTLTLNDQYGKTAATNPTVTIKAKNAIAQNPPNMAGRITTSTTSWYPLNSAISTYNIFGSQDPSATVTIEHLGPGTETLTETNTVGSHKILGAGGAISDGWHTFIYKYEDDCQNGTVKEHFCANTRPYLTGASIDQTLDIEQLYRAEGATLFDDWDNSDVLTYGTTTDWPDWIILDT